MWLLTDLILKMGKPMSTANVAPDLIRFLATLSDVTVGGSSVDQGYLKP